MDLPRAKQAGFIGGLFAIYIPEPPSFPAPPTEPLPLEWSQQVTRQQLSILRHIEAASRGEVQILCSSRQLDQLPGTKTVAVVVHFEGAEAIDPQLQNLEEYYRQGLRSLGLVWSRPNRFGYGVPFRFPSSPDIGPGLSGAGRELVQACNRLGILIDLAHLNEKGFWDVAALSDAPLVSTHSDVHALCPSSRNLTDRQLQAIRESGGMVGVNFGVNCLRPDGKRDPETPLELLVEHVDYLVEKLGIEHVGFGSDFDGATIPKAIGDLAGIRTLVEALAQRGYDTQSLARLAHLNWVELLRRTWRS